MENKQNRDTQTRNATATSFSGRVFGGENRKVLVVDDDVNLNQALTAALAAQGYRVRGETDSRKVIDLARQFRPEVIVMDMCMPNLDGGDLAQLFGEQRDLSNIPILFLTSIVNPEEAARMTESGQEFLAKPVAVKDLVARIEKLI